MLAPWGGSYVNLIGGMGKEHLCLSYNCSLSSSNKPLLEENEMQIQLGHVKSQSVDLLGKMDTMQKPSAQSLELCQDCRRHT